MQISIIVPSRNRPEKLRQLLSSLERQEVGNCNLEIVVALDGCEPDRDIERIALSAPFPVRVLALPRVGISEAKNRAVAEASGEILLFVNDDIVPDVDFVFQHASAIENAGFKHMILGHTEWHARPGRTVMDELVSLTNMIFFYGGMSGGRQYGFRHAWNLNLSVMRRDFEKVGGFSSELRPCMYEDLEMAYRLEQLGRRVIYSPKARAVHDHSYTWESYIRREAMLGTMANALWKANRDCFIDIFRCTRRELVETARKAVACDAVDNERVYRELAMAATGPVAAEDNVELCKALYLAHLPVKRRAFRFGLLAGLDCAGSDWEDRSLVSERMVLPDDLFLNQDSALECEPVQRSIADSADRMAAEPLALCCEAVGHAQ